MGSPAITARAFAESRAAGPPPPALVSRLGANAELNRRHCGAHKEIRLSRREFPTTLTDDSAIAAAAMIGDSRMPKNG
jgi:hypothetical protein